MAAVRKKLTAVTLEAKEGSCVFGNKKYEFAHFQGGGNFGHVYKMKSCDDQSDFIALKEVHLPTYTFISFRANGKSYLRFYTDQFPEQHYNTETQIDVSSDYELTKEIQKKLNCLVKEKLKKVEVEAMTNFFMGEEGNFYCDKTPLVFKKIEIKDLPDQAGETHKKEITYTLDSFPRYFIAMDFREGTPWGFYPFKSLKEFLLCFMAVIEKLNQLNSVHRDLNLKNILLIENKECCYGVNVKLVDLDRTRRRTETTELADISLLVSNVMNFVNANHIFPSISVIYRAVQKRLVKNYHDLFCKVANEYINLMRHQHPEYLDPLFNTLISVLRQEHDWDLYKKAIQLLQKYEKDLTPDHFSHLGEYFFRQLNKKLRDSCVTSFLSSWNKTDFQYKYLRDAWYYYLSFLVQLDDQTKPIDLRNISKSSNIMLFFESTEGKKRLLSCVTNIKDLLYVLHSLPNNNRLELLNELEESQPGWFATLIKNSNGEHWRAFEKEYLKEHIQHFYLSIEQPNFNPVILQKCFKLLADHLGKGRLLPSVVAVPNESAAATNIARLFSPGKLTSPNPSQLRLPVLRRDKR